MGLLGLLSVGLVSGVVIMGVFVDCCLVGVGLVSGAVIAVAFVDCCLVGRRKSQGFGILFCACRQWV